MKKGATKQEKRWMGRVADINCLICWQPAECHHITTGRGFGQKTSNYSVIPLCPTHHRLGNYGVAVHSGVKIWESINGTQENLLNTVKQIIYTEILDDFNPKFEADLYGLSLSDIENSL